MRLYVNLGKRLAAGTFVTIAALAGCDSGKPPVSPPPDDASHVVSAPTTGAGTPAGSTDPAATTTGTPSGSSTTAPTSTQEGPAPTSASTAELRWSGAWSSPSCGDRKYERVLTLKDDKTFRGEERVSPCPPKVQCIWSGIVFWQGRWELEAKGAVLTKTSGGEGGPGGAAKITSPLHLEMDKATMAPVEVQGTDRCVYKRADPSAPAGGGKTPSTPTTPAPAPSM